MELFKEAYDAFAQRIRSPFAGSILLVFAAVNWKPLWFLLFAEAKAVERFAYFEANTTIASLYMIPVVAGLITAAALPWVRLAGAWIADAPTHRLRSLQKDSARRLRISEYEKSAEEEEALARLEAAREERKIASEVRLQQARELSDELSAELEEERNTAVSEQAQKEETKRSSVAATVEGSVAATVEGDDSNASQTAINGSSKTKRIDVLKNDNQAQKFFTTMLSEKNGSARLQIESSNDDVFAYFVVGEKGIPAKTRGEYLTFRRSLDDLVNSGVLSRKRYAGSDVEYFYVTDEGYELTDSIKVV